MMESSEEPKHTPARIRGINLAIKEACIHRIDRATVPIVGIQNDKFVHNRTGVLYRIGSHHFVLTAAHYLRETVTQNIGLYLSVNRPNVIPLPLADALFLSTEVGIRDLGAIWIPPKLAAEVSLHKDFLSHNQINLSPLPSHPLMAFYGYPAQWSEHRVTKTGLVSQALAFLSFPDHLDPSTVPGYNPQVHLLINYSEDGIHALTGEKKTLPPLLGISGCGIWQVGDRVGNDIQVRTDKTLTLVAIQHRVDLSIDRVIATHVGHAMDLIADRFPDAKAAMQLVRG